MKRIISGPAAAFSCVCIVLILMCTFFVGETYAAAKVSGTTTKQEQTIKVSLDRGAAVITVSDADSWVFAQLQTTGSDKLGKAVSGANMLTTMGQKSTFVVPVTKAQTYYLYLHGLNAGTAYTVKSVANGGTLTSGKAKQSTSYANNESVVWHTIKVTKPGQLRVTVKDSSYRYPGYSKVRLKKNGTLISKEEHLIKGLGYSTVYGVSKGTYKIGVRSSSELYNITATFTAISPAEYGKSKKNAAAVAKKTKAFGIIEPGDSSARWYKVELPKKTDKVQKRTIQLKSVNNNVNTAGSITFYAYFNRISDGETFAMTKECPLNNDVENLDFNLFSAKKRTVYIKVVSVGGASGAYRIYWE